MLSHNAEAFGAPFCDCVDACNDDGGEICGACDDDDERPSRLYDFTMNKRTHYGGTTFEDLCHRAHVAPWEALGQPELAKWRFNCPCCHEVCARPGSMRSVTSTRASAEPIAVVMRA